MREWRIRSDPAFVRDLSDEKIEALIEIMYLAATADGELGAAEHRRFVETAERLTCRLLTGPGLDVSDALPSLQEALNDPEPHVRKVAAWVLARLSSGRAAA